MSAATLVELRGVRKSYFSNRVETPVLHGIDLVMKRGEFVAIMGQSGSGKSTLMNVLGCLDTPTAGATASPMPTWERCRVRHWPGCAIAPLVLCFKASIC